jgi:hypothetical protein
MTVDDPEQPREYDGDAPYLERLSREALADGLGRGISKRGDAYEVAVQTRSFTMKTTSPTQERAAEFAGIYRRLQSDLARVLEWDWL